MEGEGPQAGWSKPEQERLTELAKNNLRCCHAAIQERHRERERVEKEREKCLRSLKKITWVPALLLFLIFFSIPY